MGQRPSSLARDSQAAQHCHGYKQTTYIPSLVNLLLDRLGRFGAQHGPSFVCWSMSLRGSTRGYAPVEAHPLKLDQCSLVVGQRAYHVRSLIVLNVEPEKYGAGHLGQLALI
ncbi:hypothetical protein VTO42DRAFT_1516 [Malbranchea cinnamomea]